MYKRHMFQGGSRDQPGNVMNLTRTERVSDETLVEALSILTSPVFGSMSMAHALSGYPSDKWRVLETYTPRQIVDEVIERGIDLDGIRASCSSAMVMDTPVFHNILECDPRPRCGLCGRPHSIDHKTGTIASCGRAQRLNNPPEWRWTRATAEAAL